MVEIATTTVSEKGQIVIPKEVREEIKLHKGDKLMIIIDKGRLLIEKTKDVKDKMKDDFSDLLKASEKSLGFWNNKKDEVWNDV